MSFIADKQTLQDLNVLGRYKQHSLFSIFNRTITSGGECLLDDMFRHPLTDHEAINARTGIFRHFQKLNTVLPFDAATFSKTEQFLAAGNEDGWYMILVRACRRLLLKKMGVQQEYEQFMEGLKATIIILQQLKAFFIELLNDPENPLFDEISISLKLLEENSLAVQMDDPEKLGMKKFLRLDYLLRSKCCRQLTTLLQLVYRLDVYTSVATVAQQRSFVYPVATAPSADIFEINNCRHPALEKAIGNDLRLHARENLLFLTGANMAGKSTFMKSIGSACYLAHMGFPVAADNMRFSVKSGIYTSINVPDNLNQGISHFYAEVLRVKEVATSVCSNLPLLVIFDELFKGTNVKDAYDATLAVTEAFGLHSNCNFIISTHIIEVAAALAQGNTNIRFAFLPTVLQGSKPVYTYRLEAGVTEDRQGMMIIRNEGVLEMMQDLRT
jgi:DNA mismatch repair protein MutS